MMNGLLVLCFPVPQDFAEDDGIGEVAMLKVYIGQELVVESGEKQLNIRFLEAGAFEEYNGACDVAICEIVKIYCCKVLAIAESEKSFG
jgi:hypothetical protein